MEHAAINLRDMPLRVKAASNLVMTLINATGLGGDDPIRNAKARGKLNLNQFQMAAEEALTDHFPAIVPNEFAPKQPPQ